MNPNPYRRPFKARSLLLLASVAIPLVAVLLGHAQEMRNSDRTRGKTILKVVKKDLQNHFYDPAFNGLDLEARFLKAGQDIDQATSFSQVLGIIAQAVLDLNDSHTRFVPPMRPAEVEYGWRVRVTGETPYIIVVKPGSDAAAKGLRVGDAVLSIDGHPLNRRNVQVFRYRYYLVRPAPAMDLVVQSPGGPPRELEIQTRIDVGRRIIDLTQGEDIWDILRQAENSSDKQRFSESAADGIFIWNVPSFTGDEDQFKRIAGRLNKYKSVVLDLRGNSGGYEDYLSLLLGYFFDHDVTIGQPKGRGKDTRPVIAKTRGAKVFPGKLVVIVDSDSGSAAELFARVIQLEKRGTVIGDRTAGAVMRARSYSREMGGEYVIIYGISIAESEVIMADGQSLEKVGVIPDVLALPTWADIVAGRDPVLARAVALVGGSITPVEAGKLFPFVWLD
jgi:carboxyl-terminal processing protease